MTELHLNFLSSEISLELKIEALEVGCDDVCCLRYLTRHDLVKQVDGRGDSFSTYFRALVKVTALTTLLVMAYYRNGSASNLSKRLVIIPLWQ